MSMAVGGAGLINGFFGMFLVIVISKLIFYIKIKNEKFTEISR